MGSQRRIRKVGIWIESMTNLKYTSLPMEIVKPLASYWKYFQNVSEYNKGKWNSDFCGLRAGIYCRMEAARL